MTLVPKNQGHQYKGILALGPEPTPDVFQLATFQQGLKSIIKQLSHCC